MMGFTRKNIVFRIEDINMMSFRGINKKHGHKGRNYSLFKWQGGVNCKHVWERRVYKKRRVDEAAAERKGFTPPKNPKESTEANWTRPDKGRYPISR
jgi:hypothetical protein